MATNYLATEEWYELLSSVIDRVGTSNFFFHLAEACQKVSGYESSVITVYAADKMPELAYENLPADLSTSIRRNLPVEYLLDPFYRLFETRAPSGIYRLEDIAPDDFFKSEIYKKYYLPTGLTDETSMFFKLSDDNYLLLDMANREKSSAHSECGRRLQTIFPIFNSLCLKHQDLISNQQGDKDDSQVLMGAPLDRAFHNFGKDHLSKRECEVIQLILKGHSNKSIARLLDISVDTVKVYNKRFHSKLDISSQAELFSLFLEAISMVPVNSDEDPLTHYFSITSDSR